MYAEYILIDSIIDSDWFISSSSMWIYFTLLSRYKNELSGWVNLQETNLIKSLQYTLIEIGRVIISDENISFALF